MRIESMSARQSILDEFEVKTSKGDATQVLEVNNE
jgi:hypothetical protein